ncbi:MAG: type VI secretion system baseplate subunit TssF [Holosporales bacterium]|nr:type VI secretion system baseplate subunit TssF [Holosporales bacterium]
MSIASTNKEFLDYYSREIDFLRKEGAEFAKEFPKIAGRLNFDSIETADPHVARLIESFAFLTANIQHKIDNAASSLTNALIDVLYPHLNRPLPAMSIAQFRVNDGGNKPPANGCLIKRATELFAYASDGNMCKFSTIYPLILYPIRIANITIVPSEDYKFATIPNTIDFGYRKFGEKTTYLCEVVLESFGGNFSALDLGNLVFYINIDEQNFKKQFYMALTSHKSLTYCARGEDMVALPMLPHSLVRLGLERDEVAVNPKDQESHAYHLLQEYFHFPEKFMFFKLTKLNFLRYLRDSTFLETNRIKILFPLAEATNEWANDITKDSLRLYCTPIVNLFSATTDPIPLTEKRVFYHVSQNAYKDRTVEIYDIEQVFALGGQSSEPQEIQPYFSFKSKANIASANNPNSANFLWWSRNYPTHHKNIYGIDTEISFVDANFNTANAGEYIVYTKSLCSNRFLAEDVQQNTKLQIEMALPVNAITCIKTPVIPQYSLKKGKNNAKLIAQLSVNYLGFPYSQNNDISENLRKVLLMHVSDQEHSSAVSMLREMVSVHVAHTTRRIGSDAWRGVVDGVHVKIHLKKTDCLASWYLLSAILQKYFSMNCQINTFVELSLVLDNVEAFKLDAISGEQMFL